MTPPDPSRCQALKPGPGPFVVGGETGDPRNGYRVRCTKAPAVIVTENAPGPDGLRGAMSLCAECLEVFRTVYTDEYAEVSPIAEVSP